MIIICKDNKTNKQLEKYIINFIKLDGTKILGIDFEFNRINNERQIALCQINFENSFESSFESNKKSDIFLFYPPNIKTSLLKKLLTTKNIIKILHGSESLDIPYLFNNIIKDSQKEFCNNLFDTRYMCEYYNSVNNLENKCKIYELLLNMKVITKKRYNELMNNDKKLGDIWKITIDVKNMSKELIEYCVNDVKYLPDLYRKFPKNDMYNKIIPSIANINFILRNKKLTDENNLDQLFTNISKYNLSKYFEHYTYIDVYITVFYWLMTIDHFYHLYSINYFKKILEVMIKNILYHKLNNNIIESNESKILFNIPYQIFIKNTINKII